MSDDGAAPPADLAPANTMNVEIRFLKNPPPQWVHTDAGAGPSYEDCVYGFELDFKALEEAEETEAGEAGEEPVVLSHVFPSGRLHTVDGAMLAKIADAGGEDKAAAEEATDIVGPSHVSTKTSRDRGGASNGSDAPPADPPADAASAGGAEELGVVWCFPDASGDAEPEEGSTAAPPHSVTMPLTEAQVDYVQRALEGGGKFVVTLRRTLRPSKASPEWDDVNAEKYLGCATVDLAPFLEPGVTQFVYDELAIRPPPQAAEDKADDKKGKKPPAKKGGKGGGASPPFLSAEEDFDVHPYEANETALVFKLSFAKALVCLPGERPKPDLRPSDIIPARALPTKHVPDASKVFSSEVREIVNTIVADYRSYTASAKFENSEDCRKSFLHYLSTSGRSYAHRQKLRHSVLRIVREKFSKKAGTSKQEMEKFYNELYVYLLDLMHFSLNSMLTREKLSQPSYVPDEDKSEKWLRLAREAELVQEFSMAERYHQERLVNGPSEGEADKAELPEVWGEYARYCLRVRNTAKAEQAFKEAIAIDMTHVPSLIAFGLFLLASDRHSEAEVFLQAAVDADVGAFLPWACLVLFYDRMASSCLAPLDAAVDAPAADPADPAADAAAAPPADEAEGADAAEMPADAGAADGGAPPADAESSAPGAGASEAGSDAQAKSKHYQKWMKYACFQASRALAQPNTVTRLEDEPNLPEDAPQDQEPQQEEAPQPADDAAAPAPAPKSLPLQLAELTLELHLEQLAGDCLEKERRETPQAETKHTDLLEARLLYQIKDYRAALEMVKKVVKGPPAENMEALVLLGDIYADMGTVEVTDGAGATAKTRPAFQLAEETYCKCLAHANAGGGVPSTVYIRLGNILSSMGRYQEAVDAFIAGVQKWSTGVGWLGIGIASYRLEQYGDAEQALNESNLLNNLNPKTWAYIALVCLKQCPGREEEADQAFHQALKIGLKDASILAEVGIENLRLNRLKLAEAAFLKSLASKADATTHLLLGRALTAQRRFNDARKHYTSAKEVAENDGDRTLAESELAALHGFEDEAAL
eukprot:TRINITY_DN988_c1_g1_i1.p1 TRINITY_DN988_c1_g1~~TRINITY_DN988_c1_g1_i1.p1  ORF type:complete len:1047 (+),score=485.28 TRINITY_DN988_c1_g1_i1:99-3239(+)